MVFTAFEITQVASFGPQIIAMVGRQIVYVILRYVEWNCTSNVSTVQSNQNGHFLS